MVTLKCTDGDLLMPFYGGDELDAVYDKALEQGFGLVASNFAEPNVMMGLMEGADSVNSDLLLQLSAGACRFAGNGDAEAGLRALGTYIDTIAEQYDIVNDLDGMSGISEPRPAVFLLDEDRAVEYSWVADEWPAFPDYDELDDAIEAIL